MGIQHGATGVLLRAGSLAVVLVLGLSLATGAWGVTEDPVPEVTATGAPTVNDQTPTKSEPAPETSEPVPETSEPAPTPSEPAPTRSEPAPSTGEPAPARAEPAATAVTAAEKPAQALALSDPAPVVGEPTTPAAGPAPAPVAALPSDDGPAEPDALPAGDPAPPQAPDVVSAQVAPTAEPGPVERAISAYVEAVVKAAVVDVRGRAAACFCAVSVSVSLDGPTNAVAALGRVDVAASGETSGARSGRSGDATAVSVTGGGSASASATSGSTGVVNGATSSGTSAAGGVGGLSTTIDVTQVTTSLRRMVRDLGDQMAAAAGADTEEHVAGLLAGTRARDARSDRQLVVEVATWDRGAGLSGSSDDRVTCEAYDGSSATPSCALAIAVTGDAGAQATVLPPRLPTSGTASSGSAGAPGMATAVSVAVSGAAVSSARTGDAGVRVPRAAVLADGHVAVGASSSSATSGSSGRSVAVALTVQGASATTARSGDTGAALSYVLPADGTAGGTSSSAVPGSGGTATSDATSGDSGDAWALVSARSGASGESASGDTGDAVASATEGASGTDWSEPGPGGSAGRVTGGAGGDARATSGSGSTGTSLALVISGGSAVATATSGPTGSSSASSTGGRGGDTHVVGDGTAVVRTGDGGDGTGDAQSGSTGDATAVLVTEYDVTATARTGSSGTVDASARGGDAGCASSGIDPDRACKPPPAPTGPAQQVVAVPHGALPLTAAQPGFAALAPADEPARSVAPNPRRAPARGKPSARQDGPAQDGGRVVVRSSDSADVVCTAHAESRVCRSADTPPAGDAGTSSAGDAVSPAPTTTTPAQRLLGLVSDSPAGRLLATGSVPAALAGSPLDHSAPVSAGEALVPLLLNAAVPVLALLSLVAGFMNRRRKLAARPHIPKHRRKQPLPTTRSSRHS